MSEVRVLDPLPTTRPPEGDDMNEIPLRIEGMIAETRSAIDRL